MRLKNTDKSQIKIRLEKIDIKHGSRPLFCTLISNVCKTETRAKIAAL